MNSNKSSKNGIVKRQYHRVSTYTGPKTSWVNHPLGRVAKILAVLVAEEKVLRGETHDRKFRSTGLTKEWVYKELIRLLPWLPEWYRESRDGIDLTPDIVYNRWHKCVYQTVDGKGNSHAVGESSEHPRNNKKLQPLLENVDRLFKRNKPISVKEAQKAGTYAD